MYCALEANCSFFTVSGSTLLRENVFILVLVDPDFLLAKRQYTIVKIKQEKKDQAGEKRTKQEKKESSRRKNESSRKKRIFFPA